MGNICCCNKKTPNNQLYNKLNYDSFPTADVTLHFPSVFIYTQENNHNTRSYPSSSVSPT